MAKAIPENDGVETPFLRQPTVFPLDQFSQQRVLELRQEIASLQRDNETYNSQPHHTRSESNTNKLRRLRLLAIREELLRLNKRQKNPMNRHGRS